jgi:hypothetical protein
VLAEAPRFDVPRVDVLPPRVLAVGDKGSRWIELRDGGGVSRLDAVGSFDQIGHALRRGDGLLLPPETTAEDLYLLLAEAPAGQVALVGCEAVSPEHRAAITRDPLLAVGRCGSFPFKLYVSSPMPDPRELILLKDRMVQDAFDVIPIAELKDVAGRDIVLRMQVDATVADLVVMLGALRSAAGVWIGWGVTLDGDDIAVGVEPGLRVVEKTQDAPADPAVGSPEAPTTSTAPDAPTTASPAP